MDVWEAVSTFRDGRTGDWGGISISAGGPAFWLVIGLILALIVLYRSMRRHLRRIDFPESGPAEAGSTAERSTTERSSADDAAERPAAEPAAERTEPGSTVGADEAASAPERRD